MIRRFARHGGLRTAASPPDALATLIRAHHMAMISRSTVELAMISAAGTPDPEWPVRETAAAAARRVEQLAELHQILLDLGFDEYLTPRDRTALDHLATTIRAGRWKRTGLRHRPRDGLAPVSASSGWRILPRRKTVSPTCAAIGQGRCPR